MNHDRERSFFENYIGKPASSFVLLAQSGSARRNFLAGTADSKFIVTSNGNIAENESFFYFSDTFSKLQLNTPRVFAISPDRSIYVQEFLGDNTLSEILGEEGLSERTLNLVKQTIEKLYNLQKATLSAIDYSRTFEYERYDELPVSNDLFYFKSFIADVLELPYHKSTLLREFKKITAEIEKLEPRGLMIRDFQARNIMVNNNDEVTFIDYQSATHGPLMYDVVSFLYQAKADFPTEFKAEMLDYYFSLWKDEHLAEKLKLSLQPIILIRYLQVLGAYGFRGLVQRKAHFLASLSKGIGNLNQFAKSSEFMDTLPELKKIALALKSQTVQQKIEQMMAER